MPREDSWFAYQSGVLPLTTTVSDSLTVREGVMMMRFLGKNGNMKRRVKKILRFSLLLMVFTAVSTAQQPSPSPTPKKTTTLAQPSAPEQGEDAGNYTIISSLEIGARGLRVVGDVNKYRSDLNYHAGVRLFDSSFLAR